MVTAPPGRALVDGSESVGTSASALPDQPGFEITVQADPDNSDDIFIGDSTPVIQLLPGQSQTFVLENLSHITAKAASGTQTLNWVATVR